MLVQEILELYKLLDRPGRVGNEVKKLFMKEKVDVAFKAVSETKGTSEFIKIVIPGISGKTKNGKNPTLGILGTLGGIGARPDITGFVSDGDGALSALAVALRLARMRNIGDILEGDVIVTTHLCTNAPTEPHDPVPLMGSAVSDETINTYTVDMKMDAILSIDTSRGNRIIKNNYFAVSPTVKSGWILKVSDNLLTIMEYVTGHTASVVPITMQDITPYGNGLYHFNSIMQPSIATHAPVIGVAITSGIPVPGSATGATNIGQLDMVGRFCIEVAKLFTSQKITFYDKKEYKKILSLYGSMKHLQTKGKIHVK